MRQRHVLMESTGPTGHCPHLVESVPCEDPMCYRWLASEGICIPDHGKCGLGHRILKAVCQNERGKRQTSCCYITSSPEATFSLVRQEYRQLGKNDEHMKERIVV
ncbi:thrombospondin type-1 domain-containing protein 7B [Cricetulus griseus]|nr:thrombospondin type-1 domain-containing protein 7B [Cricetulus griseus]